MILLVMLSGILLTPVKINPKNKLCGLEMFPNQMKVWKFHL